MLSAIIANIVVTKNQPKPACFKAAKATLFSIRDELGVVVEEVRDSKVVTAAQDESKVADIPERCKPCDAIASGITRSNFVPPPLPVAASVIPFLYRIFSTIRKAGQTLLLSQKRYTLNKNPILPSSVLWSVSVMRRYIYPSPRWHAFSFPYRWLPNEMKGEKPCANIRGFL